MTIASGTNRYQYLATYLGVPINAVDIDVSALPFRAFNKIYNDWYRDPNLQDAIPENKGQTPDDEGDYLNMRRGKKKDLITSCLPWPQRGDPITLLFDGLAPVTTTGEDVYFDSSAGGGTDHILHAQSSGSNLMDLSSNATVNGPLWFGSQTGLEADLSGATANTINGIRNAFAVQRLLERDARGGARLTEILRSHFRVTSPDQRLQRPEYIGGSSTAMGMQTVHATSLNGTVDAIGDVSGIGMGYGEGSPVMYSATEHGILMTIASVIAPISYSQGLPRKFSRKTRYDYFWPAFSHLGEQPILNKEVYAIGAADPTGDEGVFGYQEAWAHYRTNQDQISGLLHSDSALPLDVWHLSEDLASLPALNGDFIEDASFESVNRAVVVQTGHHITAEFHFDIKHTRPIPTFSTPGLIDHF